MSIFLPYQIRWYKDKSPLKVMVKSRRIGISWETAFESVLAAASYGRKGSDVWYSAYTEDASLEFMRDVSYWIEKMGADVPIVDKREILKGTVRFPSGYQIKAISSSARGLRGKKGMVIIDEAAHHEELSDLLVSAKATNIWGTGRIAVISTHFGVESDFNKLIIDIEEGKTQGSIHRVTFDDAIREGFYRRVCEMARQPWSEAEEKKWRDGWMEFYGEAADEELLCIPSSGGGAYFKRAVLEQCATVSPERIVRLTNSGGLLDDPATREGIVKSWCEGELWRVLQTVDRSSPCYLGLDFARSSDLSVLVGLLRRAGGRETAFVIELRNVPHEAQRQICEYVVAKIKLGGGGFDATGNGSYLAEAVHDRHRSIEPVTITTQWYVDTMPRLRASTESSKISLPADPNSLDDLMQVRLHGGIPKLVSGRRATATGARHGDFAIALALAHSASLDTYHDKWDGMFSEFQSKKKIP